MRGDILLLPKKIKGVFVTHGKRIKGMRKIEYSLKSRELGTKVDRIEKSLMV
mgnify:FL=1